MKNTNKQEGNTDRAKNNKKGRTHTNTINNRFPVLARALTRSIYNVPAFYLFTNKFDFLVYFYFEVEKKERKC